MEKRQGKGEQPGDQGGRAPWPSRKIALVAVMVLVALVGLLAATSAVALWQRDRARARLVESREAARPLLAWLEEALEREDAERSDGPRHGDDASDASDGDDASDASEAIAPFDERPRHGDGPRDGDRPLAELPLGAAAELQRAVGGDGSEARAQGFALRAMLPARELVAEVKEATERLAELGDAESWPTLMRAYRWLARDARARGDAAGERGFLDRAVELGERRVRQAPGARAARALAAALERLAALEERGGALDRSEQQARLALQVLERQLVAEAAPARRAALRVQMSRALLALGDLERARQRRAGARGYYERASASARAADRERRSDGARRMLVAAGLRRLAPELVDAEDEAARALCGELLEQLTEWIAGDREASGEAIGALTSLLDRCPPFPADDASLRWLAAHFATAPAPAALLLRLRSELAASPARGPAE